MLVVIHANPAIQWQREFAPKISAGLDAVGVKHRVTQERQRTSEDLSIVLGTNSFRQVENGPFLLVDRCSFGDTNRWVSLVRDGHGRRGDHRVPAGAPAARWERIAHPVLPWKSGRKKVLCGQTESWSPHTQLPEWYAQVREFVTHFRKHPAGENPTGLQECRNWDDVGLAVTLNSSVGVDAVMAGVPTVTMDEGAMAWDVSAHHPARSVKPPRIEWLHWLAWTQWSHDEIAEGRPWEHLL